MRAQAEAPSNIALIKYMGKSLDTGNLPCNASFSFTLDHLRSCVVIESSSRAEDRWEPLTGEEYCPVHLSDRGREKFLRHFLMLKKRFGLPGFYTLRSANNFPADAGLASSASSFAALTLATHKLALESSQVSSEVTSLSRRDLADLSRQGSGSSCRSFYSPFCAWSQNGVDPVELPYDKFLHSAVVVDETKKAVSSSEAHTRVKESLLFSDRVNRAERRLNALLKSFENKDWASAFEICWAEFWDMHVLFETSSPSFGYMTPQSLEILTWARDYWRKNGDGPLVTMDAGPNIHFLYRPDQRMLADNFHRELQPKARVISSFEIKT